MKALASMEIGLCHIKSQIFNGGTCEPQNPKCGKKNTPIRKKKLIDRFQNQREVWPPTISVLALLVGETNTPKLPTGEPLKYFIS